MALEQQLSMGQNPNPVDGMDARTTSIDGGDDGGKTPRLPRWTRQEILVLIQGKRDAENKFRRGRTADLPFGSGQGEPKWASVSSYCRKHGVNRGPVQCRKRWSNLAGDYKKIKEWESHIREETESFWVMRNDLRRERKLPGFFDKDVYDILDSSGSPAQTPAVALALSPLVAKGEADEYVEAEPHLYDSNRSAAGVDVFFSDFEREEVGLSLTASPEKKDVFRPTTTNPIPAPSPISGSPAEKQYQPLHSSCQGQGATNEKLLTSNPAMGSTSQGKRKRKRLATDEDEESLQYQLIDVLDRNGKMLSAQLEAQNINFQLDREQQTHYTSNLVVVLDKLAEALGRIADKL